MDLSVVIPSYRSGRLIGRALASVIDEGVLPTNIVVIEDGVFDQTASVVRSFQGVRLVTLGENHGAPRARNVGLARVSTNYVMFLDADDYVEKGILRGLVEVAVANDSDVVIGPWVYEGDRRSRGMVRRPPSIPNGERIFHWFIRAFFPPCCIAWKTESVRSIGGWDERLKKDQDGELMIRGLVKGLRVSVSNEGNSVYWQHDSPFRLTRAKIGDILYASEVVFEQIEEWIDSGGGKGLREQYTVALGRYCCKTAWVAFSYDENDEGMQWIARAKKFGFDNRGYNYKSSILAAFFGIKRSSKIKVLAGSFYKRIAQK